MMRKISLLPFALGFCFAAPALADEAFPKKRGVHSSTFKASEGFELRFGVSVPSRVSKAKDLPVVLALHFGFDRSRPFPEGYGRSFMERVILPGLRDLDAVILAPDSHGRGWSDAELSGAVAELVTSAVEAYGAHPKRVLVTGYSMGGAGTWHMLAEHGDLLSAGIPMAGRASQATIDRVDGVPVRAIHSTDDELISIEPTRALIKSLKTRGQNAELIEVSGITHFQSPLFADLLEDSIPWLRAQWQRAAEKDPSEN